MNEGLFLVNNYHQALDIIGTKPALIKQMQDQQVADLGVFASWINEERVYLQTLKKEPLEETTVMEYWQKLVNLAHSQ